MLKFFSELKKELSLDDTTNLLTATVKVPKKTRRNSLIHVKEKTVRTWVEGSGYNIVNVVKHNHIDNSQDVSDNTWVFEVEKLIEATTEQTKNKKVVDNSESEDIIESKPVQRQKKTRTTRKTKSNTSRRNED
tara:strand:- start:106 stop:504 length:399 start_codon:yes stop_codon:yes gene_type:complete